MRPLESGCTILLGLLLLSVTNELNAADNGSGNFDIPDLEFLEFLGQFQTDEGEWINPNSLNTDEFDEILAAAAGVFAEATDPENNEAAIDSDNGN